MRIEKEKIDISHFNKTRRMKVVPPKRRKTPLERILVKNSTWTNTVCLKNRLIKEGILVEKCAGCGCEPMWNGKRLVLQLDHKNGDNTDNELVNLRLLCPNCHSQTETYTSRNNPTKRVLKYCKNSDCGTVLNKGSKTGFCQHCYYDYVQSKPKIKRKRLKVDRKIKFNTKCKNGKCRELITYNNESGYCSTCYPITTRKVERPSKEQILKLIIATPFLQIGEMYGVSDNAIRKWCKSYGLPYRKKDIEKHLEEIRSRGYKSCLSDHAEIAQL